MHNEACDVITVQNGPDSLTTLLAAIIFMRFHMSVCLVMYVQSDNTCGALHFTCLYSYTYCVPKHSCKGAGLAHKRQYACEVLEVQFRYPLALTYSSIHT